MTSSTVSQPTLLERLRSTPKNIRKKLKISSDKSAENRKAKSLFKEVTTNKDENFNENYIYHCRYLGRQTIYTLKPQDCYQFALQLEANVVEKQAVKASMQIHSKTVEFTYQQPSPVSAKTKRKLRKSNVERPTSEFISISNSATYDNGFSGRPLSTDDTALDPFYNNFTSNYQNNHSHLDYFNALDLSSRSGTYRNYTNEISNINTTVPRPETIQLHEIAYCVTVPNKPRLFLVTSRGQEGLTCRIFLFSSREKAQDLKLRLAEQFEKAFTEWQARVLRRRRSSAASRQMSESSISSLGSIKSQSNSTANETVNAETKRLSALPENPLLHSDDSDGDSGEEEDREMHREFKRRMSCMHNPASLLPDRDIQKLNEQFNKTLVRGSTCSDEFTSTDEDDSSL